MPIVQLQNSNNLIFRLTDELVFPNPYLSEPSGLLAIGGDLSPERLILAYENGIFPWFESDEEILWYATKPRFVLFPDEVYVSKSMQKIVRNPPWTISENQQFGDVVEQCATVNRPGQEGTWIGTEMKMAYKRLFALGFARSIEVINEFGQLVGGLYGVELNGCFFGESMFALESNASKFALIHLCKAHQYRVIDCQVHTEHLESMGAKYIPFPDFLELIQYQ